MASRVIKLWLEFFRGDGSVRLTIGPLSAFDGSLDAALRANVHEIKASPGGIDLAYR